MTMKAIARTPYLRMCCSALAAGLLLTAVPAAAEMSESIAYRYYTAEPRWYQSLASAMLGASPVRENGKSYLGHTTWTVKWDMDWTQLGNGQCAINRVRTHLHSVVTLPQAVLSDAQEQSRFDTFLAALRAHELDHVSFARDAAREIDQRIQRLPPMPSCDQLETAANELGQMQLSEARQRDLAYDRETGHGKTQGAVLD